MEWQPKKTMPKDGSDILVALPVGPVVAKASKKGPLINYRNGEGFLTTIATHWLPIPKVPQ